MQRYTVILYPEEEGGYSVLVPSLPGCVTQGETVEEALEMARDAIELYISVLRDRGENVPAEITPPVVATVEVSLRDRVSA
jgi:antitoxin HicB